MRISKVARRWSALVIGLALVSMIAACGGDDESSSDTPAASAGGDTTVAPETTAADPRADWPEKLVLGAVPSEESTALVESYSKLIEVLEEELGLEVEFFQATDYAGIIEAQIAGKVDLAQYGPFSYVIARFNDADIAPIGALVDAPDEKPGYQSYGIVKTGSDITDLEGFRGKKVCFVDPGSTSGYLDPSAGLLDLGIDPEVDVTPVFAGGHDASVISVNNGDCDAGFAFDAMVDSVLIESGDIAEGDITTVWKSEVIAGSPLAMQNGLPESLKAEITRLVLEVANRDQLLADGRCTSADDCGLTDENAWGWVVVEDSFYDGVRAVCEATKSAKCEG
jgi:phosphonate transport system substrate-binding protein